ncbi:MAG: hypothetical protein GIW97_05030 [Candidatus Eremiobacteraeota bacterium]|nr:hypothetical protein [Candidatus Eremiobacteraeota bacterium]
MSSTFAIVLSKGSYVVGESCALRVIKAIEDAEPHVLVNADLLGDGLCYSLVRLVTAHVIAIVDNAGPKSPNTSTGRRLMAVKT